MWIPERENEANLTGEMWKLTLWWSHGFNIHPDMQTHPPNPLIDID
jgi:hypothetical protein